MDEKVRESLSQEVTFSQDDTKELVGGMGGGRLRHSWPAEVGVGQALSPACALQYACQG